MVLLLFSNDPAQSVGGFFVNIFESGDLLMHMPQHNRLNGYCGSGDGFATQQAC